MAATAAVIAAGTAGTHLVLGAMLSKQIGTFAALAAELAAVGAATTAYRVSQILRRGGPDAEFNAGLVLRRAVGWALQINFLIFWAVPIFGQGQVWKKALQYVLHPLYNLVDRHAGARKFAATYIYERPHYADFFATMVLVTISSIAMIGYVLYHQIKFGFLPWYVVFGYYCAWVGFGGRSMGAAYTFAHKEGHFKLMYKPWIRNTIGHWFENVLVGPAAARPAGKCDMSHRLPLP
jgi:hypothetical protein